MKIIFLDFDGVITTYQSKWKIDMNKIKIINNICNKTNAKIVVSSSWRIGYAGDVSAFHEYLKQYFIKNQYLDHFKDTFDKFISNIIGMTESIGGLRGDEINFYLKEHPEVNSYVIIDDDSDMLDQQLFNFVQTDTYEGITERDAKLCVDILNGVEVINPIRMNDELKFRWRLCCRYPEIENNIKKMLENYRNNQKFAK
ncbi:hypothetical protein J6O48_07335 [bacterium]|nr:hypothetical protein [bacterium]